MKKNPGRKERRRTVHINRKTAGREKMALNTKVFWPPKGGEPA